LAEELLLVVGRGFVVLQGGRHYGVAAHG